MKKSFLFVLLLCLAGTISVYSQDAVVNKIIEIGRTDNQVMVHLDILTNRFGGRLAGSDAYENAAQWVAYKFRQWGLDVEFHEAGTVPVGFNREPWFGKLLGENAMDLHLVTPSYSSGTKGLQRGQTVIEPRTKEEFDRMKHHLKGAWVLVSGTNSGWALDYSARADSTRAAIIAENEEISKKNREIQMANRTNGTNEPLLPYKEMPALFYKEMAEAGVLGFIQSSSVPLRALYDRNVVQNPEMTFENLPTLPDIKLDEHQYQIIKQMTEERRSFVLEFDIRNHFKMGPVKYYSVIGTIKGSEYPDEYVLVTGHLDAFDVATGGVDCGSGVTPVMEAARMIKEAGGQPKRTMQFIAFAAEEFGLLGAKAYVRSYPERMPKIANMFNRDGGPLPPVGLNVPAAMYNDFVRICEPIASIRPDIPFMVNEVPPRRQPTQAGGTDATVFAMEGVPTLGFIEQDVLGYNFNHQEIWHTERDLYTKSIPEYQEHAATVTAIVAYGVANLDKQLNREGLYSIDN